MKRGGVVPEGVSEYEDSSGKDLPRAAAIVAVRCRPRGTSAASRLANMK